MAEQELRIKISVDKQTGELSTVGTEFNKLTDNAKKADAATKSYTDRLKNIATSVVSFYAVKKAVDIATSSLSSLLNTAGEFEKFESVLTTLEGSSKKSQESFAWIKNFATTTPYQLTEVTDAFVKLRSYGINPMDGTLKTLGDTSAAMGKPLVQAVEAMADAVVGENERLKEFGIRASVDGEKIAYSWSDASGKAKYIVIDNNSKIIQSTLNAIFNSKYQDAMQNMMTTWGGLTSNLEDNWTSFKNTVAHESGLFDGAKAGVKEFNEQFSELSSNKEVVNALGNTVFSVAEGIASAAIAVSYPIRGVAYIVKNVETAFSQLSDQAGYAFEAIKSGAYKAQRGINSLNPFASVAIEIDLDQKIEKTEDAMRKYVSSFMEKETAYQNFIANTETSAKALATIKDAFGSAKTTMLEYQTTTKETTAEIATQNGIVEGALDGTYSAGNNKLANEYKKALETIKDETAKLTKSEYDYGLYLIDEKVKEYKKAGVGEVDIAAWVSASKSKLLEDETKKAKEESEKQAKEFEEQFKDRIESYRTYYEALGDEQEVFYIEESAKMEKLARAGILSNEQMLQVWEKDNEKFLDEQFKKNNEWLFDFFDNVDKALDEQFLDGMKGKFKSFGDWVEDLFGTIGDSVLSALSRSFAGSLTNTVQSGVVNLYKTYGGLSASSSLVGTTVTASDVGELMNNGGTFNDATNTITTAGGTAVKLAEDGSGTVEKSGSDILSIASTISSIKTAYDVVTGGISASIMTGFNGLADVLASGGYWSAATGVSNFGYGVANPFSYGAGSGAFTSTTVGAGISAGLIGAGVGYGVGWLGDKLFGADTYAGTVGAIGGALGGIGASLGLWGGPVGILVGSVLGSVLGGIFGKTKVTGSGIEILGNATAEDAAGRYYTSYKKKSWFSSKSWTTYTGFSDEEIAAIEKTIGAYDYMLAKLGEYDDLVVAGGRFSNLQEFLDTNVVKAFLTSINPNDLDTIYQSWVDYAEEIDTTIAEAISTVVSGYITDKRDYTEWLLGDGTLKQLSFTSSYLKSDFEALAESLGASGVTVDNFLSMYDAAVKNNFTQENIEAWQNLGDMLTASTDAAKKYKESLASINDGIKTTKQTYTEWLLGKGTTEQLAYTSNYLKSDVEALAASLGASGVTVDNFLSMYDAAIKKDFTEETIKAWTDLGDALMNSTDAAKAYQDALDSLNSSTSYSLPEDMLLKNVSVSESAIDLSQLVSYQQSGNSMYKQMLSYLYEIVKAQKALLDATKFSDARGIPA